MDSHCCWDTTGTAIVPYIVMCISYVKQKQLGAVKKGVAKQSRIKSIEALVRACR